MAIRRFTIKKKHYHVDQNNKGRWREIKEMKCRESREKIVRKWQDKVDR